MTNTVPGLILRHAAIASEEARQWSPTHQHRKGGFYRVLATGLNETDREDVVIYDDQTGQIWVRPAREFWDGRFTPTDGH